MQYYQLLSMWGFQVNSTVVRLGCKQASWLTDRLQFSTENTRPVVVSCLEVEAFRSLWGPGLLNVFAVRSLIGNLCFKQPAGGRWMHVKYYHCLSFSRLLGDSGTNEALRCYWSIEEYLLLCTPAEAPQSCLRSNLMELEVTASGFNFSVN